jgi:hypothetical protein
MEHVQIPPTVVFESMMKSLGLPCPVYENCFSAEESFTTKVMFYPSMHFLRTSSHPHSIYSYPTLTLEASVRDAARLAIEYMEKVEHKVPSSFKDIDLQQEKETSALLRRRLDTTSGELITKSNQLISTANACEDYIDNVTESTHHIKKIVSDGLAAGCPDTREAHRNRLLQIQTIAVGLSQRTASTIAMVKAAGPFPYVDEPTYLGQASESYES